MAAQAKPHDPSTYSGQREMNVLGSWVFTMERYLRITMTKEELWVDLASTYLDGMANTWFQTWYPLAVESIKGVKADASHVPWDVFVHNLRQAFQPPNHHQHLCDSWFHLKQTGSVAEYVHEFRALRLQLAPSEDEALDKFVRGLKFNTRRELLIRNPMSIDDAIQMADRYDLAFTQSMATPRSVSTPVMPTGVHPMELDSVTMQQIPKKFTVAELERLRATGIGKKLSTNELGRLKATGACFYCFRTGHMSKNCPEKKSSTGTSRAAVVNTTSETLLGNNQSQ